MEFSKLNIKTLTDALPLLRKREALAAQIEKIEKQLAAAFGVSPAASAAPAKAAPKRRRKKRQAKVASADTAPSAAKSTRAKATKTSKAPRAAKRTKAVSAKGPKPAKTPRDAKRKGGRRGALKSAIIGMLTAAGSAGVGAKEISTKLGIPNQNVHVWFSSTGKNISGLDKKGPGRWALKSGS